MAFQEVERSETAGSAVVLAAVLVALHLGCYCLRGLLGLACHHFALSADGARSPDRLRLVYWVA